MRSRGPNWGAAGIRSRLWAAILILLAGVLGAARAQSVVIEAAGKVEVWTGPGGSGAWLAATNGMKLEAGARLRTGAESRAALQFSDRSILRLDERTTLELQPPRAAEKRRFRLWEGVLFFFNREKPSDVEFETPLATGAIRGTEFALECRGAGGRTRLTVFEGAVELTAGAAFARVASGEEAVVEPGGIPEVSPVVQASRRIQWALYYPAVIPAEEFGLDENAGGAWRASLAAYRSGDLRGAKAALGGAAALGDRERVYLAALDLSAGRVDLAEERLRGVSSETAGGRALRELIDTVRQDGGFLSERGPRTAGEWLARSHALQGAFRLEEALKAARTAAALAPASGIAHARAAELNFALGRRTEAWAALRECLSLSPKFAQAWSLRGFFLLEQSAVRAALASFEEAARLDSALGSAWLGKGISRMRLGDREGALESLQRAAALEPRRALHRSYLAKGFVEIGGARERRLADKEFRLAKELDPGDPTAWLYSALLAWRENRPNEAVRDLERSAALNDNRQLFRSRQLLDQDLAARQANLAAIYRDAGLPEAGLRAAWRALAEDYANFSSHLFLANGYRSMEDPRRFDLRWETARQSELLMANLLAPPEAANLSQLVSQQEQLRYFSPGPFSASSFTEYRGNGDWRQEASFFGALPAFGYALDLALDWENGEGTNSERERRDASLQLKHRVTARDSLYYQIGFMNSKAGDAARHYDPADAKEDLRVEEEQIPNLYLGWHREWAPSGHTLFLVSRLSDEFELKDREPNILFFRRTGSEITSVATAPFFDLDYSSRFTLYSAEAQHLWQGEKHGLIVGGRGQAGEAAPDAALGRTLTGTVTDQQFDANLGRLSGYAYHQWKAAENWRVIAGLSYDRLRHPANTEAPPLARGEKTREQLSPKLGVMWTPWEGGLVRAGYFRGLGGVYFDQSMRLEPSQVAGLNQAFRSLAPESAAGLVPGAEFEGAQWGMDQVFGDGTYAGLEAEALRSKGDRELGVLTNESPLPIPDLASSAEEKIRFEERNLSIYAARLLGEGFSAGLRYRVSEARLETRFPGVPRAALGAGRLERTETSLLHEGSARLNYQHRSGFFAQWESVWRHQENRGYDREGGSGREDVWQHHIMAGYRWRERRAELRAGVLNLTDADYRLSPLNYYLPPPRGRTAVVSLRLRL